MHGVGDVGRRVSRAVHDDLAAAFNPSLRKLYYLLREHGIE